MTLIHNSLSFKSKNFFLPSPICFPVQFATNYSIIFYPIINYLSLIDRVLPSKIKHEYLQGKRVSD